MTRHPAVAGTFYPSSPFKLQNDVQKFLNDAPETKLTGKLRAIIVPHAGYMYSGPTAAFAYKLIESLKKVILIGPAHYAPVEKFVFSKEQIWETPLGEVKLLQPLQTKLNDDHAHAPEHSLEVQLPFLQTISKDFKLLPILINDKKQSIKLAKLIEPILDDDTIVIISSDLSHFHTQEEAQKIDSYANEYIPKVNIDKITETVEACGVAAILTLMHLAQNLNWKGKKLTYETSAKTSGDTYRVVGYGAYAFYE